MNDVVGKPINIAFVATYPPRQCGIATFTSDLLHSIGEVCGIDISDEKQEKLQVVALNRGPEPLSYPSEVRFEIREQHESDYRNAADFLNLSPVEIIVIQHEFGIFGGDSGSHIIRFLEKLEKPAVTVLHTIPYSPTHSQRKVLRKISSLSTFLVAQSETGVKILKEVYSIPDDKIEMIYHGVPDVPFLDPDYYKYQFQAEDRFVILTFGLLNPSKGIEFAIDALPEVIKKYPEVLYFVVGATHPAIKARYGEQYRILLERRVAEQGLERNVVFHNRFVPQERLIQFLVASDVYLAPYLSEEQIVSGTLSYSLGCGKVVISTPSWYAKEILSGGRGIIVPFRDSKAIAERLLEILSDEGKRNEIRKEAYQFSRGMVWNKVALRYTNVFERALLKHTKLSKAKKFVPKPTKLMPIPEIDLSHLRRLTDSTGILQHSIFAVPNRFHGYTTDDNARALLVTFMNWDLLKDREVIPLMNTYLSFINHALDPSTGRVRNFMSYERKWLEEVGSEDSQGRTIWSLGYGSSRDLPTGILELVIRLFRQSLKPALALTFPRPWAFSIMGGLYYLQRFPGDREVRNTVMELAERLYKMFKTNAEENWPWCEDVATYENARLPEALIMAGHQLGHKEMLSQGLKSLEWLLRVQSDPKDGHLSIIGNKGWFEKGKEKAKFDQQPVEAAALLEACYAALLTTQDSRWEEAMKTVFNWFLGRNDQRVVLYNFSTGGCFDGLLPGGVNQNQGAESTLCWLISLHRMQMVLQQGDFLKEESNKE